MSDYKRTKGRLILLHMPENPEDREEFAKKLICESELPSYYDSFLEWLDDDGASGENAVKIDGKYYLVEKDLSVNDDPEYCNVTKNSDGSYSFEAYYYNGGTTWEELLEGKLE